MEVGKGLELEVFVCEIYSNAFDTGYILVQYSAQNNIDFSTINFVFE